MDALLAFDQAQNFTEFRAAAALVSAPSQNLLYADTAGNIGYQLAVCTDVNETAGRRFAEQYGCRFVPTYEEVCRDADVAQRLPRRRISLRRDHRSLRWRPRPRVSNFLATGL